MKRILAAAATLALAAGTAVGLTGLASASTCTSTAAQGTCPSSGTYSLALPGSTYDLQDVWNPIPGWQQALAATDASTWSVAANMPNGNTAVVSYPDTQDTITTTANDPAPMSVFGGGLTSHYSQTDPAGTGSDYEWAYDIWAGPLDGSSNYGQEIMVWTDNPGGHQRPAGTELSANVTIGGSSYQVWSDSPANTTAGIVTLVRNSQASTGTEDLYADLTWLRDNGYQPATYGINQIDYGAELCSTGGAAETFALSGYTLVPGTGTTGTAPVVTTSAPTGVSATGATANGTVNPEGAATTYQFEYGTTTAYGTMVPATPASAGSGSTAAGESASLTGLTASTTYHYRLDATNATGTSDGPDQSFTTPPAATANPAVPIASAQIMYNQAVGNSPAVDMNDKGAVCNSGGSTSVIGWSHVQSAADEEVYFIKQGDGFYSMHFQSCGNSFCVWQYGFAGAASNYYLHTCDGSAANDQFYFASLGSGWYSMINIGGGPNPFATQTGGDGASAYSGPNSGGSSKWAFYTG